MVFTLQLIHLISPAERLTYWVAEEMMASPVSAGAAALIQSYFNYTGVLPLGTGRGFQIGEKMKQTCDPMPSSSQYNAGKLGKGRIDVNNALTVAAKSLMMNPITITDGNDDVFLGGETLRLFALTLIIGVVAGTYASLFFAPWVLKMLRRS